MPPAAAALVTPASMDGSRSARATRRNTQVRNFGMIQVRLRLCDARASERQLFGVMYGYTIIGTLNGEIWNPYGDRAGSR